VVAPPASAVFPYIVYVQEIILWILYCASVFQFSLEIVGKTW
jgi:hypothetical protein